MNAGRDSSDEPEAGLFGGRALLIGAVALAAAATGLLILTDQQKWLRLGIVAALWAALTGAYIAARYRRQLTDQREAAEERQELYELELEREVAARREHELTVEAEARRKADEQSRDDIAALRDELTNLRQTLEGLMGGEVLVERYALQAEATRMRSLGDDRALPVRRDVKHLSAAQPANIVVPPMIREAETELIERVREVHQKPRREQPAARSEPRVVESGPASVPRQSERPPRPKRPTSEPVKPTAQPASRHEPRYEHPAEVSDRWFMPDGLLDDAPPQPPRRSEQPRRQEPQRPADPPPTPAPRRPSNWDTGEQEWGPSWEKREEPRRPDPVADSGAPIGTAAEQTSWLAQYNEPKDEPAEQTYGSRAYVPQSARPEPEAPRDPEPAGHRHRVEEEESGGRRRRRAEGQPSWQESGRGEADESSGSHASGRSVSELLANHGLDSAPRRRRRRED